MKKILLFISLIMLTPSIAVAQENWMLKGYLKGMSVMQTADQGDMLIENILHNRLDFNWYASDAITTSIGIRNRIITGNNVSQIPNYSDYISRNLNFFDLNWLWADESSWIGISQIDRLFVDYVKNNFQVTVGRQRINWGQAFVWNPNDVFNTYSYFDFDYEERPGSDAVRLQYYLNESSKLELSTSINNEERITSMALYRVNLVGYDFQLIGGIYNEDDIVLGGGWSGSIAGGGFSGEFSYYTPLANSNAPSNALTAVLHYDYTFSNSLQLQFETLYNGFGTKDFSSGVADFIFMDLSPKSLFPTQWAVFGSGGYDITPLFRVVLSGMYGPEGDFVYVGPTGTFSISNTIELAAFGQIYWMEEIDPNIPNSGSALFVRLKWSF